MTFSIGSVQHWTWAVVAKWIKPTRMEELFFGLWALRVMPRLLESWMWP
jgi:hypothetical protein